MRLSGLLMRLSVMALPVIFAITLARGGAWVRRLSLRRRHGVEAGARHVQPAAPYRPLGTILMPLVLCSCRRGRFMFGYAKPVPVAFARLHASAPRHGAGGGSPDRRRISLSRSFPRRSRGCSALVPAQGVRADWLAANLYVSILSTSSSPSSTCCRCRRSMAAASPSDSCPRRWPCRWRALERYGISDPGRRSSCSCRWSHRRRATVWI